MKLFIAIMLFFNSCTYAEDEPYKFSLTFIEIQSPDAILGKWTLSDKWSGHMGVTIEFTKNNDEDEYEYKYWFYSDVKTKDEPKYPVKGKWELVKGVLTLTEPAGVNLYSKEWMMVKSGETMGLLAPDNIQVLMWHKSDPDSRMLYKKK